MSNTELNGIFEKIDFVKRYQQLCADYNDFEHRMKLRDKKFFLEKLKSIDAEFVYLTKDKMFKLTAEINNVNLNLGLSLHDGLVEAMLFYIKNGEWLIFNRFDFMAEELDSKFDRGLYNVPKYTSESDLNVILTEIITIYKDVKMELIR